jgi:hypothetical protein
LSKIWNIPKNTGTRIIFYSNDKINAIIQELLSNYPLNADFKQFDDWNDFQVISGEIRQDDNLILVLSRENRPSFHENMIKVPALLNTYFRSNSFILIYPMQLDPTFIGSSDRNNPSLLEPIEKLDEIINNISNIFRRK